MIDSYYKINELQTAHQLVEDLYNIYSSELEYFFSFPRKKISGVQLEILKNLQFYNELLKISIEHNHPKNEVLQEDFEYFYQKFLSI